MPDIKAIIDYLNSVLTDDDEDTSDRVEAARVLLDYAIRATPAASPQPGA